MNKTTNSALHFETAKKLMPGGVNSPVRAFKSVGGTPIFIKKGKGSRIWDEDDNEYLDFCGSWGPLILGHANSKIEKAIVSTLQNGTSFGAPTVLENELATLIISNHFAIEKIRFVSSGTEAVMSAIRLARGVTKRDKILKFEGCYHGHADSLLVKAGSGLITFGVSTSAGVPENVAKDTIVLALNDFDGVEKTFKLYGKEIAAVIIEPIPANNGLLLQNKLFLNLLRKMCDDSGALLIFDEVISGFRVGFEGASGLYKIKPDLITFGKIIGGGLPVGAYAGSSQLMDNVSPEGAVYQAGTLSGNPVAMAAGISALNQCLETDFYHHLQVKTSHFVDELNQYIKANNYPLFVFNIGSIFWLSFSKNKQVESADKIDPNSMQYFKTLHKFMLEKGVYFGPSGYEVGFVSSAHTEEDLQIAKNVIIQGLDKIFKN